MAETEEFKDVEFVSEVSVEGDLSDRIIVSTLSKLLLGTRQTVSEAFHKRAKDCVIVGKVVEIKKGCYDIEKLILSEVTTEGCIGSIFALFALGRVAANLKQFSVKVDDILVIHQPVISKSCLINFPHLQTHPYELQAVVQHSSASKGMPPLGLFIQLIRSKVPEVVEGVAELHTKESAVDKNSALQTEDSTRDKTTDDKSPRRQSKRKKLCVPEVVEGVAELHTKESAVDKNSALQTEDSTRDKTTDDKSPRRQSKRKKLCEEYVHLKPISALMKVLPRHCYTKLGDITASCLRVNIMGVITNVENGCQCVGDKEHLLIYLQDESSGGKNFVLNLSSYKTEIPPLHKTYIMRALNVTIVYENEVIGWVRTGKSLATIDGDSEKPISLLTVQESCTLSEEDEDRILELRNFIKTSFSLGTLQIPSDESCSASVMEKCAPDAITGSELGKTTGEESLKLHLSHSIASQAKETHSLDSEESLKLQLSPSTASQSIDVHSNASEETICLDLNSESPTTGTVVDHHQESLKLHLSHSIASQAKETHSLDSEESLKLQLSPSTASQSIDVHSNASEETICLDLNSESPTTGTVVDHHQESNMQYHSSGETDCSENLSLPTPDVGSDADAMQGMWNFVMQ